MICKGASRRSIPFWTKHLLNDKTNARAEVKEIRGLAAENLHDALLEMEQDSKQTRCKNFFYQCVFAPAPGIRLTDEQWETAFSIFEKHRGIPEGQPRVVIEHEKHGEVHRHVVWSRTVLDNLRAWPDGLDAKIGHAASHEIREKLGLEQIISPFDKDREGERPPRSLKSWEMFRGLKTGLDPREIKAEVTRIFRGSENAADFVAGLREHGYQLVQGDRRDFCIMDSAGEVHSLARRIDGVKAKELRAFMQDFPRESLPTVEQAKALHGERMLGDRQADLATVERAIAWEEALAKSAIEKEKVERRYVEPTAKEIAERREAERKWPIRPPTSQPTHTGPELHFEDAAQEVSRDHQYIPPKPLRGMSARIQRLYDQSQFSKETNQPISFAEILEQKGIGFARVTAEDAERSHREAEFARAVGNYAPKFLAGEIVAVTASPLEYRREGEIPLPAPRVFRLDQKTAAQFVDQLGIAWKLEGIEPTKQALTGKAAERADNWEKIRLENATQDRGKSRSFVDSEIRISAIFGRAGRVGKVLDAVAGKVFDTAADMVGSLLAPTLTPAQKVEAAVASQEREIKGQERIDLDRYTGQRAIERQELDRLAAAEHSRRDQGRER